MTRRVAITGVGAVTPLGGGAEALYAHWAAGESAIEDGLARCSEFEPTEHLSKREVRRADRFTQFALVAAREALNGANWAEELPYDAEDLACVIGTGIGGIATIEEQHAMLSDDRAVSPLCVPQMMPNAAAGQIAMRYGIKGESFGAVSACAAGTQAIGVGMRMIQHGDATACVVGGTEAGITPLSIAAFGEMGATSETGISRPFDSKRDGFVMGEGAGILVLEDADEAEARGARILAYLSGYGATADAHHLTAPDPEGAGAARAIIRALDDAGRDPGEIDYVNAHGTSTPLNDASEARALRTALGDRAEEIPISSLKSSIGHLLGAAGAVEAVATVLALDASVAPPTLNLDQPDPELGLDFVPGRSRELKRNGRPLAAISNSFGFGGHNAVLCLEGTA